jgi:hypothetical protein
MRLMKLRNGTRIEIGKVFGKGLVLSGEFRDGELVKDREVDIQANGLFNVINGKLTDFLGETKIIGPRIANGKPHGECIYITESLDIHIGSFHEGKISPGNFICVL